MELIQKKDRLMDDFMLNENELTNLTNLVNEPNVFEILGITFKEIHHSKLLAWLLDPNENHELGDAFLRECIRLAIKRNKDSATQYITNDTRYGEIGNDIQVDKGYWLFDSFQNVEVSTEPKLNENGRLDIKVNAEGSSKERHKYLLVIENKVMSKEGSNQTSKYFEDIMKTYESKIKKLFIYLVVNEDEKAGDDHWTILTYDDVVNALNTALKGKTIPDSARLIIDQYIKTIEKNIVGDTTYLEITDAYGEVIDWIFDVKQKVDKNKKIANYSEEFVTHSKLLYQRHSKVLKYIYNNKKKANQLVAKYIRDTLKEIEKEETSDLRLSRINRVAYIGFNTDRMDNLLGGPLKDSVSPWGTKDKYYYEFHNALDEEGNAVVSFYLVLGGGKNRDEVGEESIFSADPSYKEKAYKIADKYNARTNDQDNSFSFKRCHVVEDKSDYLQVFNKGNDVALKTKVEEYVRNMISGVKNAEDEIEKLLIEKTTI